jgi:hypothetical protein
MASEPTKDLWALVLTSNRFFVGQLNPEKELSGDETMEFLGRVLELNEPVVLCPVFEISAMLVPVPSERGMVMQREVAASPVLVSFDDSPIHILPEAVSLFAEMKPEDRARYKRLVDQATRMAVNTRAAEAGLITAGKLPGEG